MKKNMGLADRIIRTILAIVVAILYFTNQISGTAAIILGIIAIIFLLTSWQGLLVLTVASGIGLFPLMWNSRRLNLLAVILVPVWLNMAGIGPEIAGWLGLL